MAQRWHRDGTDGTEMAQRWHRASKMAQRWHGNGTGMARRKKDKNGADGTEMVQMVQMAQRGVRTHHTLVIIDNTNSNIMVGTVMPESLPLALASLVTDFIM